MEGKGGERRATVMVVFVVCLLTSSRDVMVCLHCGIRETKVDVVGEL